MLRLVARVRLILLMLYVPGVEAVHQVHLHHWLHILLVAHEVFTVLDQLPIGGVFATLL